MENNVREIVHERELLQSRLEKMFWGSIEIREKNGKQYIYVHRKIDGVSQTKYVDEYSNPLYTMVVENNQLAKEYKKRLKEIKKYLDSINYVEQELTESISVNISLARRNMVDSIYKQAVLEGVVTTYSDTETIVNGGKVSNMTSEDITKVVNLKRAWEFILSTGVILYPTNYTILCQINGIVEDGMSILAGKIRSIPAQIGGTSYIPPVPLESKAKKELDNILSSDQDQVDIAISLLLFTMKKQLFLDGNKRTAVIFANHYLISHGLGLIVIPADIVSEFKILLIDYYEDKNQDIRKFLREKCYIKLEY